MEVIDRLRDKNTSIQDHSFLHYLVCVLLRIGLGVSLVTTNYFSAQFITRFCILISLFFFYKAINNSPTWKVYSRTVLTYLLVAHIYHSSRTMSGTLIIMDALLGLQSRHIATLIKE